jgi:hypothetical protein
MNFAHASKFSACMQRRIELLNFNENMSVKIKHLITEAEKEGFPCLKCSSKDECEKFLEEI